MRNKPPVAYSEDSKNGDYNLCKTKAMLFSCDNLQFFALFRYLIKKCQNDNCTNFPLRTTKTIFSAS